MYVQPAYFHRAGMGGIFDTIETVAGDAAKVAQALSRGATVSVSAPGGGTSTISTTDPNFLERLRNAAGQAMTANYPQAGWFTSANMPLWLAAGGLGLFLLLKRR